MVARPQRLMTIARRRPAGAVAAYRSLMESEMTLYRGPCQNAAAIQLPTKSTCAPSPTQAHMRTPRPFTR
jgi:hypothetical protein